MLIWGMKRILWPVIIVVIKNFLHGLLMQLRIRGISDILFLNRRINKGRIMMVVFIILVIQTNAFLKNKFNPRFTDTFTEMNQF